MKFILFTLSVLVLSLAACAPKEKEVTHWPMSGGPEGSWRVQPNHEIPLKWSVRTGENIKWKTALPEGGQSGIAVYGDKLFLTINPPLDTPPLNELEAEQQRLKTEYDALFSQTEETLAVRGDGKYLVAEGKMTSAEKEWLALLETKKDYQNAKGLYKSNKKYRYLRETNEGKLFQRFEREFVSLIHNEDDRLAPYYKELKATENLIQRGASSANIVLYCLNAETGEILWNRTIKGTLASGYHYGFSDSTTPSPITDGQYVWAINASGGMACFNMNGKIVWDRTWKPVAKGPFNKQYDSILYGDWILNAEPPEVTDASRSKGWHYLHAFNKATGERAWVSEDALTQYNAPVLGKTADGVSAVMIGRGGPHEVPERPVGLSLVSLEGKNAGKTIWRWKPDAENKVSGWGALSTQHWDQEKVSWFYSSEHLTVDSSTGKTLGKFDLATGDQYRFDRESNQHVLHSQKQLERFQNQRHCNFLIGDHLYYMVRYQPFLARHNVKTGKNEFVEVPTELADGSVIYGEPQKNDGLNSRGQRHGGDMRTRGDGFQKCFLGSPTMINQYLYFTNALGIVYVVDTSREVFDAAAVVAVNDLGPRGETWSVNSLSFANENIYHRTMKEVICIGR